MAWRSHAYRQAGLPIDTKNRNVKMKRMKFEL